MSLELILDVARECGGLCYAMDGGNTVLMFLLGYNLYGFADRLNSRLDVPMIIENLSITNAVYHAKKSFNNTQNLVFMGFCQRFQSGAAFLRRGRPRLCG